MNRSLLTISQALRKGDVTSAELTAECTHQMEIHEELHNAYKLPLPNIASTAALAADAALACGADPGPLAGLPCSIKDLFAINGSPTFAGSSQQIPESILKQGPIIEHIRSQLGVIVGKTHTVEFAFGGIGINSHWGTPRNPWDAEQHRVPGGSSAGAGVSIIQQSALYALGTDTAGSVRIPASFTGNVGLKTSAKRWSLDGIFPLSPTLDTPGILARSVEDTAYIFAALDPYIDESPEQFISRLRHEESVPVLGTGEALLWEHCSPDIVNCVITCIRELERAGAILQDTSVPEIAIAQTLLKCGNVSAAEISEFVSTKLPSWLENLDPLVGARIKDGGSISAAEWLTRQRQLSEISDSITKRFEYCDFIVSPTVPISPPLLKDVSDLDDYRPANMACLSNTCAANSLTLCALTIPVGLDQFNMPVGLQLMAPYGQEERLLATGLWIESIIGIPAERLGKAPRT